MALTLVAPYDAAQTGSEHAGGNSGTSGWESNSKASSPIDTRYCSSEVIPENETPAIACEIYSVTTCTESDTEQPPESSSPKSLTTASVASGNGDEDDQNCSSMPSEESTEAYYLPKYQTKTEDPSLSPYNPPEGGYDPAISSSSSQVCESSLQPEQNPESSAIRLVLEDADLWKQFDTLGNEMIITKAGR